jgi:hypothetical protein
MNNRNAERVIGGATLIAAIGLGVSSVGMAVAGSQEHKSKISATDRRAEEFGVSDVCLSTLRGSYDAAAAPSADFNKNCAAYSPADISQLQQHISREVDNSPGHIGFDGAIKGISAIMLGSCGAARIRRAGTAHKELDS